MTTLCRLGATGSGLAAKELVIVAGFTERCSSARNKVAKCADKMVARIIARYRSNCCDFLATKFFLDLVTNKVLLPTPSANQQALVFREASSAVRFRHLEGIQGDLKFCFW